MDLRLAHHFLQTNEWRYLFEVFRYHMRVDNRNIKVWKVERANDDRWDDTVETLAAVELAMQALEQAVRAHNGPGIAAFEASLAQLVRDVLGHYHRRTRSANELLRGGYDKVKMEFERAGTVVECHRLWGGVKYVRVSKLLRRIHDVLLGDKYVRETDAWPEWSEWPQSGSVGKYQVAAAPVVVVPVLMLDGDYSVAVPLAPITDEPVEEEQGYLDTDRAVVGDMLQRMHVMNR
jgi:hypothetical protein